MKDISEESVEEAIHVLVNTEEEYARVRAGVRAYVYTLKVIEANAFLGVPTGSIDHRKSVARCSSEYKNAIETYRELEQRFGELEERRETARLIISVYQSRLKAQSMGGM